MKYHTQKLIKIRIFCLDQHHYESASNLIAAISEMSQQQQQTTTRSESFINTASKLLEKVKQQQQQLKNMSPSASVCEEVVVVESGKKPAPTVKSASYRLDMAVKSTTSVKPPGQISTATQQQQQLANVNSIKIK